MAWLKAIWSEVLGLFVDDGSLAIAILVWLAACWFLPKLEWPAIWAPAILFFGLVLILAESALRRAGQRR